MLQHINTTNNIIIIIIAICIAIHLVVAPDHYNYKVISQLEFRCNFNVLRS